MSISKSHHHAIKVGNFNKANIGIKRLKIMSHHDSILLLYFGMFFSIFQVEQLPKTKSLFLKIGK